MNHKEALENARAYLTASELDSSILFSNSSALVNEERKQFLLKDLQLLKNTIDTLEKLAKEVQVK